MLLFIPLMAKLVCLVGMPGAGKSSVAKLFSDHHFSYLRFGQITIDIMKERGLKMTQANEKIVRERVRKEHGMAAYAILNIPAMDLLLKEGNVIVDGLYSWSEYKVLKEKYGEKMIVIAIYAPPQLRYKRLTSRTDVDAKMINRVITPTEAAKRDSIEIENIEKGGPIAMADYTILNVHGKEELRKEVEEIVRDIGCLV